MRDKILCDKLSVGGALIDSGNRILAIILKLFGREDGPLLLVGALNRLQEGWLGGRRRATLSILLT